MKKNVTILFLLLSTLTLFNSCDTEEQERARTFLMDYEHWETDMEDDSWYSFTGYSTVKCSFLDEFGKEQIIIGDWYWGVNETELRITWRDKVTPPEHWTGISYKNNGIIFCLINGEETTLRGEGSW